MGPMQGKPVKPQIIELDKQGHRWVFRYAAGDEEAAFNALVELVGRGGPFDWFDAATVSYEIKKRTQVLK